LKFLKKREPCLVVLMLVEYTMCFIN